MALLVSSSSYGQHSNFSVTQYNTDNGLPQSSVKSIVFDKAGYCWIATEMGLVRFDGKIFKTFTRGINPGVSFDRIKKIALDVGGNVYASTADNQYITIGSSGYNSAPQPQLVDGKPVYLPATGFVEKNPLVDSLVEVLLKRDKHPFESLLVNMNQEESYLTNKEKLFYITKMKVFPLTDQVMEENRQETAITDNYYIHILKNNRIKTWRKGVFQPVMNLIGGELKHNNKYLNGYFKVLWCQKGTFIYAEKKLYRLFIDKGQIISQKIFDNLDIPDLYCMYYSQEQGKYYFGSQVGGLYIVEPSSFKYPTLPKEVISENFYPQSITKDGRIFSNDVLFSQSNAPQSLATKSKDGMVSYIDTENQLFYESNFTLSRYDLNTNRNYPLLPLNRRLRSILPDGRDLIFCTSRSIGIISSDTLKMRQDFPGLTMVSWASRIDKYNFLLGSDQGVKWYNMRKNTFTDSILDSLQIRNIQPDSGKLWIASYGKGFFLYEKGQLYRLPFGPKESLKTVHAFIDDGSGHFWLPTNNGLFKVRKSDLVAYAYGKTSQVYFYMFTKQNGLRTNEFNGGCYQPYVWMKDRMLSLSSMDGLVWFYPGKTQLHYPDKKIYFDEIFVGNTPVYAPGKPLKLNPDFDNLSIFVSSPYFGNSENFQLEYKIAGISDHWKVVPANGNISISRSPSGNYKLQVRRLSPGQNELRELLFVVNPWFYNTWWFYLILTISFMLVAYLIGRQRLKSVIERANQLEILVKGRTIELSLAIEQIAQSESALLKSTKVKDRVITMVLHDLRSPIRFLRTISDYLASNHQNLNEAELHERLAELQSGTNALRDFTEQFFTWAVSQHEDFKVNNTLVKIQALFEDLAELYSDIAKNKKNLLTIEATDLKCHTDHQMLALILRNLIDNANKNTASGLINLSASASENSVSIYIKDTGKGLTAGQVNSFIDESKEMGNAGTGSILILNMIQKIGGKLEIITSVDKGSTFIVTLSHQPQPDTGGQG